MKCCSFYPLNRNKSWCLPRVILFLALFLGFVRATTPEATAQLPILSINTASRLEGDSGTTLITFTVTLSAPSGTPVIVRYFTSDGNAKESDGDYVPVSSTPLVFNPGETVETFTVQV